MKMEQQTRVEIIDMPRIAIRVAMLDTGIDVHEIAKLRNQIQELPASSVIVVEVATAIDHILRIVYQNRKANFILFIRHILGIEILAGFPDTVAEAFDQFTTAHTNLNSRQLEFLRLLKDFIIEREKVEKRDLIESPFTIIHPQGIRGVFRPAEIDEILQLTEKLAA